MSDEKNPMKEFCAAYVNSGRPAEYKPVTEIKFHNNPDHERSKAKVCHFSLPPWEGRQPIPESEWDYAVDFRAERLQIVRIMHAQRPCDHQGASETRRLALQRSSVFDKSGVQRVRAGDYVVWCDRCGEGMRYESNEDQGDPYYAAHINKIIALAVAYERDIRGNIRAQGLGEHPITARVVCDAGRQYCVFPESEAFVHTKNLAEATGVLAGVWQRKYPGLVEVQKAFRDGAREFVAQVAKDRVALDRVQKGLEFILGPETRGLWLTATASSTLFPAGSANTTLAKRHKFRALTPPRNDQPSVTAAYTAPSETGTCSSRMTGASGASTRRSIARRRSRSPTLRPG